MGAPHLPPPPGRARSQLIAMPLRPQHSSGRALPGPPSGVGSRPGSAGRRSRMKRILVIAALLLTTTAGLALAEDMPGSARHRSIGLGFHNTDAPIGVRWWLSSQKVGIDLGLGYSSRTAQNEPRQGLA